MLFGSTFSHLAGRRSPAAGGVFRSTHRAGRRITPVDATGRSTQQAGRRNRPVDATGRSTRGLNFENLHFEKLDFENQDFENLTAPDDEKRQSDPQAVRLLARQKFPPRADG
ncbi:MAG: hypothetical protein AAF961_04220 [Planctomycetota bacterium]